MANIYSVITSDDDGNYDHLPQSFVTRQAAIDAAIAFLNSTIPDARPLDIDVRDGAGRIDGAVTAITAEFDDDARVYADVIELTLGS